MMQQALRARLLADADVSALVSTRIDWDARPQGKPLPAITLQVAFDPRDKHMGGTQATRKSRVRAQCWATKPADAHNLAEAVISALDPGAIQDGVRFLSTFATSLGGIAEDTDNGLIYRQIVDLDVIHTIP
jgi:hypothetical protein